MTEAAARVAADEQTPAYVYDLDEVRRAWSLLHEALPRPAQLLYSLKANPHPAIVRTLARLGCSAEVREHPIRHGRARVRQQSEPR